MMGKFAAQRQPLEDEEPMMGKFPAQRQPLEDEEPMMGKFPAQRQPLEDEEPMMGEFPAQRQIDEKAPPCCQGESIQKSENRTGFPDNVVSKMTKTFGPGVSDVRAHPTSSSAVAAGALAYTRGSDIHFAPGQFKPGTTAGQRLIGHEMAHVVQQGEGRVKPTGSVAGMPLNDNPALEREADILGKKTAG